MIRSGVPDASNLTLRILLVDPNLTALRKDPSTHRRRTRVRGRRRAQPETDEEVEGDERVGASS